MNEAGKDEFKKNVDKATKFIESCFDENNKDDGLTFDERINQRIVELPAGVRNVVVAAQGNFEENPDIPDDEIEEIEECECDCKTEGGHIPPQKLLKLAIDTKQYYLDKERALKVEKARLKLETDWTKIIEGKSKPSETEKKDWITFETSELQEEVDDLKCESEYLWELWELEKIMLRKH